MTAIHDAILATLNGMVRIFTRSAPALPGKSGLAAAAANLVNLIATLPEDSGVSYIAGRTRKCDRRSGHANRFGRATSPCAGRPRPTDGRAVSGASGLLRCSTHTASKLVTGWVFAG